MSDEDQSGWPHAIASIVSDLCILAMVLAMAQCASGGALW